MLSPSQSTRLFASRDCANTDACKAKTEATTAQLFNRRDFIPPHNFSSFFHATKKPRPVRRRGVVNDFLGVLSVLAVDFFTLRKKESPPATSEKSLIAGGREKQ
jgi:hypothetical protein